jgi:hypothetical protein
MPIEFNCPNGHALRVKDEYAGKKSKCPKCGAISIVPAPARTGAQRTDADDDPGYEVVSDDHAGSAVDDEARHARGADRNSAAPPKARSQLYALDGRRKIWWIGSGGVAGFCAVVVPGIVLVLLVGRGAQVSGLTAASTSGSQIAAPAAAPGQTMPQQASPNSKADAFRYPMTPERVGRQQEKLGETAEAIERYHSTHKRFPIADDKSYFDEQGRPFLSWRVHLLTHLGKADLWQQFKPTEPWDSPHNLPLLDKIPDVFLDEEDPWNCTSTRIVTLSGPDTLFPGGVGLTSADWKDGRENTIVVLRVGRDKAVPWTKPEDAFFDSAAPFESLGIAEPERLYVALGGRSAARFRTSLPVDLFKALVTPAGGEKIDRKQWEEFAKD